MQGEVVLGAAKMPPKLGKRFNASGEYIRGVCGRLAASFVTLP